MTDSLSLEDTIATADPDARPDPTPPAVLWARAIIGDVAHGICPVDRAKAWMTEHGDGPWDVAGEVPAT